jgi:hypothetical protein
LDGSCVFTGLSFAFAFTRRPIRVATQAIVTPKKKGAPRNQRGPNIQRSQPFSGKTAIASRRPARPSPAIMKEIANNHQNKLRCLTNLRLYGQSPSLER